MNWKLRTKMKPEKGSKIGREKIIWTKAPFKKLNRICILYHWKGGLLPCQIHFSPPKLVVCDDMILALNVHYGVMQNTTNMELTVGPIPHMEPTKQIQKGLWHTSSFMMCEYQPFFSSPSKKNAETNPWQFRGFRDPFFGDVKKWPEISWLLRWPPTGRCFNNYHDS